MSATQFGLGLLVVIAVAVICYAAGWWQGRQLNATGGENAPLHKINWRSGVNRVKGR